MLDERWIRSLHVESMRHADLHAERARARALPGLDDRRAARRLLRRRPHLRRAGRARRPRAGDAERARRGDDRARRGVPAGRRRRRRGAGRAGGADAVRGGDAVRTDGRGGARRRGSTTKRSWRRSTSWRPTARASFAVRLDGRFASVRARSVPKQEPPYRPLAEVVADQHVFELTDVEGTMVGFRFPAFIEGIEVAGYHLHFVDTARRRGGHVLGSRAAGAAAGADRPLRRPPRRAAARGRPHRPRPRRRDPRRDRLGRAGR